VPLAKLTGKSYARSRAASIDPAAATPSERLATAVVSESGNTTHYSVIDADGTAWATLSINFLFGAGVVAGDAGYC